MNASSQPEITAGIIIGSVMIKDLQRRGAKIHRRLFNGAIQLAQPRGDDHRHIRRTEGDVRQPDGEHPAIRWPADGVRQRDKQQEQRQTGDDVRHDQRAVIINAKPFAPRKRPKRTITSAAIVPSTQAIVAASAAMVRLSPTALIIASSWNSSLYQRVDQPAQTVTSLELLNE